MTFTIWSKLPKSKCWQCPQVLLWRWWMRMFASQSRPLAPFLHGAKGAGHPMANPKTRSIYLSIHVYPMCLFLVYLSYWMRSRTRTTRRKRRDQRIKKIPRIGDGVWRFGARRQKEKTCCVRFLAAICWLAGMSESRKPWSLKAQTLKATRWH